MAHFSPEQQQALMGVWHDIVGKGPGGGGGGHGGGHRGGGSGFRAAHGGGRRHDGRDRGWDRRWGAWGYPGYYGYPGYPGYGEMGYGDEDYADDDAAMAPPMPAMMPGPDQSAAPAVGRRWDPWRRIWVRGDEGAPGPQPRNWMIEQPAPTHAGREILPMSTGVPILPSQSAQITAKPQRVCWRMERFVISNAGTSGGAADWVVNDIKIGNQSQFAQSGDVPGDMFATNAIDTFVSFQTAQTAMDVVVVVTYIGLNESGCPFFGSAVGTSAI
jgi:hypothetical protein